MIQITVPSGWPAQRPLAISVSVMLEGWAEGSAPGIGPMGNPLKPGVPDLQALSWAEYGPKVGAWRLLDLLDPRARAGRVLHQRRGGRALSGSAGGDRRARACRGRAWLEPGHAAALPERGAEQADIARCVDVLTRTGGRHPDGWLSPRCTPRAHDLAPAGARAGFRWHADMFDADLPYRIDTEDGIAGRHAVHHGGERHAALCALRQ